MNADNFKRKIRKLLLGYDVHSFSFSQAGEDIILMNLFHNKIEKREKGFYIDIGCYDPVIHSNTFLLYLNGWSGINIDANPGAIKKFEKKRPKDINLNIAISTQASIQKFYMIGKNSTMNSLSLESIKKLGIENSITEEIQVQTNTLKMILKDHLHVNQQIDLLTIDAEGLDEEILISNDWNVYRPKVIVVEIHCEFTDKILSSSLSVFLIKQGYLYFTRTIITPSIFNLFFIDQFSIDNFR